MSNRFILDLDLYTGDVRVLEYTNTDFCKTYIITSMTPHRFSTHVARFTWTLVSFFPDRLYRPPSARNLPILRFWSCRHPTLCWSCRWGSIQGHVTPRPYQSRRLHVMFMVHESCKAENAQVGVECQIQHKVVGLDRRCGAPNIAPTLHGGSLLQRPSLRVILCLASHSECFLVLWR